MTLFDPRNPLFQYLRIHIIQKYEERIQIRAHVGLYTFSV
jgi:hypothetical protein